MKQYEHVVIGIVEFWCVYGVRNINWSNSGDDYDNMMQEVTDGLAEIIEVDDTPVPTVDDLRIAGYGSIGDQLDMQYKDALNGTTTWVDHIAAVKAANPK
jgi:hypothetical protein